MWECRCTLQNQMQYKTTGREIKFFRAQSVQPVEFLQMFCRKKTTSAACAVVACATYKNQRIIRLWVLMSVCPHAIVSSAPHERNDTPHIRFLPANSSMGYQVRRLTDDTTSFKTIILVHRVPARHRES